MLSTHPPAHLHNLVTRLYTGVQRRVTAHQRDFNMVFKKTIENKGNFSLQKISSKSAILLCRLDCIFTSIVCKFWYTFL